ncbi:MAG: tyrosine-type recombinase/integrase [Armatimonadetes bacterium]|nr:tyrosine-type recombinase/integrase [Armatimonadota bacterium]
MLHFEEITTAELRRFISFVGYNGAKPETVARHVHAIRSFWRFVVETYELGTNAALPLRAPKPQHRIPEVLSEDECRRLLEAADKRHYRLYRVRDRLLLELMMVTALRRGELIGLCMGDYDAEACVITVRTAKGGKWRRVPLPRDLCRDIETWLAIRPPADHDRLLTTRTGAPLTPKAIYRALRSLAEIAHIDPRRVTPHLLRHTAATLVLRQSGDPLATSRLLGHSSVAMTGDVYCHLTDEDVRRAVGRHPLAGDGAGGPSNGQRGLGHVSQLSRVRVEQALRMWRETSSRCGGVTGEPGLPPWWHRARVTGPTPHKACHQAALSEGATESSPPGPARGGLLNGRSRASCGAKTRNAARSLGPRSAAGR